MLKKLHEFRYKQRITGANQSDISNNAFQQNNTIEEKREQKQHELYEALIISSTNIYNYENYSPDLEHLTKLTTVLATANVSDILREYTVKTNNLEHLFQCLQLTLQFSLFSQNVLKEELVASERRNSSSNSNIVNKDVSEYVKKLRNEIKCLRAETSETNAHNKQLRRTSLDFHTRNAELEAVNGVLSKQVNNEMYNSSAKIEQVLQKLIKIVKYKQEKNYIKQQEIPHAESSHYRLSSPSSSSSSSSEEEQQENAKDKTFCSRHENISRRFNNNHKSNLHKHQHNTKPVHSLDFKHKMHILHKSNTNNMEEPQPNNNIITVASHTLTNNNNASMKVKSNNREENTQTCTNKTKHNQFDMMENTSANINLRTINRQNDDKKYSTSSKKSIASSNIMHTTTDELGGESDSKVDAKLNEVERIDNSVVNDDIKIFLNVLEPVIASKSQTLCKSEQNILEKHNVSDSDSELQLDTLTLRNEANSNKEESVEEKKQNFSTRTFSYAQPTDNFINSTFLAPTTHVNSETISNEVKYIKIPSLEILHKTAELFTNNHEDESDKSSEDNSEAVNTITRVSKIPSLEFHSNNIYKQFAADNRNIEKNVNCNNDDNNDL